MKFNVVVVDDEQPAIDEIVEALLASGVVGGISSFSLAGDALKSIAETRPDIVFADIQMPGMNGLKLTEALKTAAPECEVVFVTAYEQYALTAFRLAAADYLLKPVEQDRLNETLHRIQRQKLNKLRPAERKPEIFCFGSFRVFGEHGKIKWRTAKVGELLAYLYVRREVTADRLIDDVIPDIEADRAKTYLHTTVYQLRKNLSEAGLAEKLQIHYGRNVYELQVNGILSDLEQFDQLVEKTGLDPDALRQVLSLYKGDFLEGIASLWALEFRESRRRHFIRAAGTLMEIYEANREHRQALELAQRLHRYDPLNEGLAVEVARLYLMLNQHRLADDYIASYLNYYREEVNADASEVVEQYRVLKQGL